MSLGNPENDGCVYVAKNYPKSSEEIEFKDKSSLKKWLLRKEITFGIALAIGLALGILLLIDEFEFGFDLSWIVDIVFWPLAAYCIRKFLGFILSGSNDDNSGFITAVKAGCALLLAMTVVLPVIWIVKEVKQFVALNALLKN